MSRNNDLLKFIIKRKIPLREAIEILEEAEKKQKEKEQEIYKKGRKSYEKAVLSGYETR
jgi:hypothetical protein